MLFSTPMRGGSAGSSSLRCVALVASIGVVACARVQLARALARLCGGQIGRPALPRVAGFAACVKIGRAGGWPQDVVVLVSCR